MTGVRLSAFLAGRALARSNYGIAAATTLMMLLIYVSLLFLPSLIQGAVDRVNSALVNTLTSNIVITPAGSGSTIDDAGSYLHRIRGTAGVAPATAVYHVGTQVSHGGDSGSWSVDAMTRPATARCSPRRATYRGPCPRRRRHQPGAARHRHRRGGPGPRRGYRASLQTVHAGDKVGITLTSGKTVTFSVAGIFNDQIPQADGNAYITQAEARKLEPASAGRATAIYVRTRGGVTDSQEVSRRSCGAG